MAISNRRNIRQLINPEEGEVSREVFVNSDLYQMEQEQVFARAWLFIGHESQVPNPDDYVVSSMGEESVILTRDKQGKIHVLLNTCRHRGMRVCRYDAGNTPVFSCPYHGWSYSTDGNLVKVPGQVLGVPHFRDSYHEMLDKEKWGLVQVAQMVNYKGTIWATWDPNAPSFEEYLGPMRFYLDVLLDHRDGSSGGSEVIGGVVKWQFPANWKFAAENFTPDSLHTISHRSVEIAGIGPGGPGTQRGGGSGNQRGAEGTRLTIAFAQGHGVGASAGLPHMAEDKDFYNLYPKFISPVGPLDNPKIVQEYFDHVAEQRKKNLTGKKIVFPGGIGCVFPNMTFHSHQFPRSIAVWQPRGANLTEGWRWCLIDKDAPKEVKDLVRHHFMRYSGPAGMTEQDDMENWNYAHAASSGTIARRLTYNYQCGLGFEEESKDFPGALVSKMIQGTEQNQFHLYKTWAKFMEAEDWGELKMELSKPLKPTPIRGNMY